MNGDLLPEASIAALVGAGLLAPSGDNCQPWRFQWDGASLRVLFMPERAESFYDGEHFASWLSLGAVLENMAIVARSLGLALEVDLFPSGEAPDVVANITMGRGTTMFDPLVGAIPLRCVNRRAYEPVPLAPAVMTDLRTAGKGVPGVEVKWVEDTPTKARLARLAAVNDRLLFENRPLHDGLYRWLRWTAAEVEGSRDGMPVETLELSAAERPGIRLLGSWGLARVVASLGVTRLLPLRSRVVYARSAALGLVTVAGKDAGTFVQAGKAIERIWLTAALRGVAFQPITGLTFLLLRVRFANCAGLSGAHRQLIRSVGQDLARIFPEVQTRVPAMLFRVGLAERPSGRASRLPISAVFTRTAGSPAPVPRSGVAGSR